MIDQLQERCDDSVGKELVAVVAFQYCQSEEVVAAVEASTSDEGEVVRTIDFLDPFRSAVVRMEDVERKKVAFREEGKSCQQEDEELVVVAAAVDDDQGVVDLVREKTSKRVEE